MQFALFCPLSQPSNFTAVVLVPLLAEADQNARSFLFQCTLRSQIETVKQIIGATPEDSCSLTGVPRFATIAATRLVGWEFVTTVEGVGEVSEEKGVQETLLHVAVRVGCVDLAAFFIDKGTRHRSFSAGVLVEDEGWRPTQSVKESFLSHVLTPPVQIGVSNRGTVGRS